MPSSATLISQISSINNWIVSNFSRTADIVRSLNARVAEVVPFDHHDFTL